MLTVCRISVSSPPDAGPCDLYGRPVLLIMLTVCIMSVSSPPDAGPCDRYGRPVLCVYNVCILPSRRWPVWSVRSSSSPRIRWSNFLPRRRNRWVHPTYVSRRVTFDNNVSPLYLSCTPFIMLQALSGDIDIYVLYSAHQKSGDNLSFSYYLPLQHHVLSILITPMHVQTN